MSKKKKDDKRRGKRGNGKMVQFPQQQQPPQIDEALLKRITVASENTIAVLSDCTLLETKAVLETVESIIKNKINKAANEFFTSEKLEVPSADDTAKT